MDILEHKDDWSETFRHGWLAHLEQTGEVDWQRYRHPRNERAPGTPGIQLKRARLLFISSSGAYLAGEQEPFDAADVLGDYTIRRFPSATPLDRLAYAHDHYDHALIDADPQVALPLRLLEERVSAGEIGSLAPSVVSFQGYQPDSARVVDELVPQVLAIAGEERATGALLAPV